jgi:N-carbamoylputrescine amidase
MNDVCVGAVVMRSGFGERETNLERIGQFVRTAAAQGVELICFPEMGITGYGLKEEMREVAEPIPGPSSQEIQRLADENDIIIIAGLAERVGDRKVAITQIIASPGDEMGLYRKLHLSAGEQALFVAGDEVPVFTTEKATFAVQLCYDAHFPELSTVMALRGAEIVFVPHASPPPETADEKRERWLRYLSARAYDNSVFLVACNQRGDGGAGICFSGVALVLDPRGEVIAATSDDEEKLLTAVLKADVLERTRSARMGFFLPQRRPELYSGLMDPGCGNIGRRGQKIQEGARGMGMV